MTRRFQLALTRRWRTILLACALISLAGAVLVIWARIVDEGNRADGLEVEANRRGSAVTTLADDVRVLRAQIRAEGGTPKAPDPSKAVSDLVDRAKTPVTIPGPRGIPGLPGVAGIPGTPGQDGPTASPGENGKNGQAGQNGQAGEKGDSGETVTGPPGADGQDGRDGVDGRDGSLGPPGEQGPPGPACPDGYSLQQPALDPDALVCRRD